MQHIHTPGDWFEHAQPSSRLERFEAFFGAHAFDPHRHDTYAIGRTVAGVHRFNYRGESKLCLPGEIMIVHPDESHDGRAGTDTGFRYRGVYVPPALVQQIVPGKPLPFFKAGLVGDVRLAAAADALLDAQVLEPMAEDDALYVFVTTLAALGGTPPAGKTGDFTAATRAREFIDDNLDRPITLDDLAACSSRDRWNLSHDFRRFFGTSPHRYLTLRRLDRVKQLARAGRSLADAAVEAGFFDQSHMSRHFKKTFGLSPLRWCGV